jgi:dTDP-glucose 4,6-dehydratase
MILMKNILITGGAGFIGSNYVRFVRKEHPDYNVTVLDKLTYAANKSYLAYLDGIELVQGDICDKDIVSNLIKKTDLIVNFAAETHVDNSIKDSAPFVRSNIFGVHTILEEVRKHKIEKYLQISTDEVYGSIDNGSFKETDILNPRNPYSATKAAGDLLCRSYFSTYNIPVVITRSSNNYGPAQHLEKFMPVIIKNALSDKKIPVYGNGKNIRDWLFVEDNCRGIDAVLHKGRVGEVYNIGGENEKTNIDLVKTILKELKKPESLISFVEDRLGHDKRYSLNIEKIKKELGWSPKTDLADGIKTTVRWYRNFYKW